MTTSRLIVVGLAWLFATPFFFANAAHTAFAEQDTINSEAPGIASNLVYIRSSISVDAKLNTIHGDVRAEVQFPAPNDRTFSFHRSSNIYTDLRVIAEGSPIPVFSLDSLSSDRLLQLPDSIQAESFFISWHFTSVNSFQTFPLDSESGEWKSVYARPDAPHSITGGLVVHPEDSFVADTRVVIPSHWQLFAGLDSTATTVRATSDEFTAHIGKPSSDGRLGNLTLLAFHDTNPTFLPARIEQDSLFATLYQDSRQFFGRYTDQLHQPQFRVSTPGLKFPESLSSDIELIPELTRVEPPTSESTLLLSAALAASDLTRNIRLNQPQDGSGPSDVWLVDSIESFLIAEYVGERLGDDVRASYMSGLRDQYLSDASAALGSLIHDPGRPNELARHAKRAKGAWIMQMLFDQVGSDIFQSTIIDFVSGGPERPNANSDDFRRLLEEKSGRSFETFFEAWVAGSGHPVFTYDYVVRSSQDAIDVRIQQVQGSSNIEEAASIVFPVSTTLAVYSIGTVKETPVNLRTADATVTVPIDLRPQSILLDPTGRSLFETSNDLGADHFITPLRRATTNEERLSILNQIADRPIDSSHLLGVRPLLTQELSDDVHGHLIQLIGRAAPSSTALRDVLAAAESTESISVRSAAIRTLVAFQRSPEARASALAAANGSQDPFILAAAVEALITLDSTLTFQVLQSAMVTDSENDFVRRQSVRLLQDIQIDPDQLWQLLENIVLGDSHPATRLAALEASGPIFSNLKRRTAVLALWPMLRDQERLSLARLYAENTDAESLKPKERSELTRWLTTEPFKAVSGVLSDFLAGS